MTTNEMHGPTGSEGLSDGEDSRAKGFTTIELLVAFLLFGIILASSVGLLMSQRSLYDVQSDKIALQMNVRAAVDLVASELRMIPDGAVVTGAGDSVVVRYPFRWGLVCNYANKTIVKDGEPEILALDAEVYIPTATDPLFTGHTQSGVAYTDSIGDWVFVEDSDEPWEDSLYIESMVMCVGGPGAKVTKDTFDKDTGDLILAADTAGPDYRRWMGYLTYTGEEAYHGAQVIAYATVTYRFGASAFEPGTRALFRITSAGEQELSGLFDDDAGFQYVTENGTLHSNLPVGQEKNLAVIRINAFATKTNQAGGSDRALDYDATVDVVLRNSGEQQ